VGVVNGWTFAAAVVGLVVFAVCLGRLFSTPDDDEYEYDEFGYWDDPDNGDKEGL
jgi:hypothetical protein